MGKEHIELVTLEQFHCLGADCPEHCCGDWSIMVDTDTRKRWELCGGELQEIALTHLTPSGTGPADPLVLKKVEQGHCVCLSSKGLCRIQENWGHEYLPHTCQTYPRHQYHTSSLDFLSARFSCPEVVRLALFESGSEALFRRTERGPILCLTTEDKICRALFEYQEVLFAETKFLAHYKLYVLADLLTRLYADLAQNGLETYSVGAVLKNFLGKPKDVLSGVNTATKQGKLPCAPDVWVSFWRLCSTAINLSTLTLPGVSAVARDAWSQTLFGSDTMQIASSLQRDFATLRHHMDGRYEALWSRYTQACLMNRGFPLNPYNRNLLLAFASGLLILAAVNLFLMLACRSGSKLDDPLIARIIWTAERRVGHSQILYATIARTPALLEIGQFQRILLTMF